MQFWTSETWMKYEDEGRWAKLRVKNDNASGEDYFDILIGKAGQDPHVHIGIALDQTLLFAEYRGLVHKIARKIESQRQGLVEEKESIVDPNVPPLKDLILKLNIDTRTGQITIADFGLKA
jgi:hypothetical protein